MSRLHDLAGLAARAKELRDDMLAFDAAHPARLSPLRHAARRVKDALDDIELASAIMGSAQGTREQQP